jgi:exosortase
MFGARLSRSSAFLLAIIVAFLLPMAIPGVGLDYPYFFITVLVLFAWFLIKWEAVKGISTRAKTPEILVGLFFIGGIYLYDFVLVKPVGILDLVIIFAGVVLCFYGVRSVKLFWVPMTYGIILLAGYQIELYTPNYVALQNWLAGVMTSTVNAFGIHASVSGEVVQMTLANGSVVFLDVASSCTGLQGILAFGLLSTMALLDLKPRKSRLLPIFSIGFVGAFLINILRLLVVFVTFEFFGESLGDQVHVYFGYLIFIAWVLAFWALAFKYLAPPSGAVPRQVSIPAAGQGPVPP